MSEVLDTNPDAGGHWGRYGGRYVPETLMAPLEELTEAFESARRDPGFQAEFDALLRDYSGRPTPLFHAARLSEHAGGARVFLKREDLSHTGSHKINNALGQVLLARRVEGFGQLFERGHQGLRHVAPAVATPVPARVRICVQHFAHRCTRPAFAP